MNDHLDRWPPPGLERVHAQLWNVIGGLGIGGVIMIAPLLFATVQEQTFSTVGNANVGTWAALAAAVIDFLVLIEAYLQLQGGLRDAARASRGGYSWRLIALVAADQTRDTGFLIKGAREFADVPELRRRKALHARLFGTLAYLAGVLWLPIVFPLGLLLAQQGVFSATMVWTISLFPVALLLLVGVALRVRERVMLRGVRRPPDDVDPSTSWNDDGARKPRTFAASRVLVWMAVLLLFIPLWFAVSNTATTKLLDAGQYDSFGRVQERLALVEVLRPYALPKDSTITPLQAGEALYSLASAGEDQPQPQLRQPARRYGAVGTDSIDHPALQEFDILARAPALDEAGALYVLPFPDTMSIAVVPIVQPRQVRNAATAQIAKASQLAKQRRFDEAIHELREIISASLLILDNSNFMFSALIAQVMATNAADSLESVYAARGDSASVQALRAAREAAVRASRIAQAGRSRATGAGILEEIPAIVLDPAITRGFRWEMFVAFNSYVPCLNQRNLLFGPGREYQEWLRKAHAALVRYPADGHMFELGRRGFLGTKKRPAVLCGARGALEARRNQIL